MARDRLPIFRPGDPLKADDLNAIVANVVTRIHGPNVYIDSTGVYLRPPPRKAAQEEQTSHSTPLFIIVSAKHAFSQLDNTFQGDVIWRPTGTLDPDPQNAGLTIDNFANLFFGEIGSIWFCVRQSPEDRYMAIQGSCPQLLST